LALTKNSLIPAMERNLRQGIEIYQKEEFMSRVLSKKITNS
jgi:hypothetical protein